MGTSTAPGALLSFRIQEDGTDLLGSAQALVEGIVALTPFTPTVDPSNLSATELSALQTGGQIAFLSPVPPVFGTGSPFDPLALDQNSASGRLVLGVGAVSDQGRLVAAVGNLTAAEFVLLTRQQQFDNGFLRFADTGVTVLNSIVDPGGIPNTLIGVLDGSSTTPIVVDVDFSGTSTATAFPDPTSTLNINSPVAFALATPLTNLSGTFNLGVSNFAATGSNGVSVSDVTGSLTANLNLGSGTISGGLLDVLFSTGTGGAAGGSNSGQFSANFDATLSNGFATAVAVNSLTLTVGGESGPFTTSGFLNGAVIGDLTTPGALLGFRFTGSGNTSFGQFDPIVDGVAVFANNTPAFVSAFTGTETSALQNGNQIGIAAGAPLINVDTTSADPFTVDTNTALYLGLGAFSDDGDPLLAYDGFSPGTPGNFATQTRTQRFDDAFVRIADGVVPTSMRTDNPGGLANTSIGLFDAVPETQLPVDIDVTGRTDFDGSVTQSSLSFSDPLIFGIAPLLTDLTATADFTSSAFAARSNAGSVSSVFANVSMVLSLGSGTGDGNLTANISFFDGPQRSILPFSSSFNVQATNGILSIPTVNATFDPVGGEGASSIPATGIMNGAVIGEASNSGLLLGFQFSTTGTGLTGADTVNVDGVVTLNRFLTSVDTNLLNNSGKFFAQTRCCTLFPFAPAIEFGRAEDPDTGSFGNVGFNTTQDQIAALPDDPVFFDTPVNTTLASSSTSSNSPGTLAPADFSLLADQPVPDLTGITRGLTNSTTNTFFDPVALPTAINTVVSEDRRLTIFQPAVSIGTDVRIFSTKGLSNGTTDLQTGRFPNLGQFAAVDRLSVSFIADPASGLIRLGRLFAENFADLGGGNLDVAFGATIDTNSGNGATLISSSLFGADAAGRGFTLSTGIDPASSAGGAFANNGDVFTGVFNVASPSTTTNFAVGAFIVPARTEERLNSEELGNLDRLGFAAFNPLDTSGNLDPGIPAGFDHGSMVGFTDAATTPAAIVGNNTTITTGANEFFALPADNVLRPELATASDQVADVGAGLLGSPAGFQVSWGRWNGSAATPLKVFTNTLDPTEFALIGPVLFASLQDTTPVENIASMTGSINYGGSNLASIGVGGPINDPDNTAPLDGVNFGMSVDFSTGMGTGTLIVGYTSPDVAHGSTSFTASLNGNVTAARLDLSISSLIVTHSGISPNTPVSATDLANSRALGLFNGTNAEQLFLDFGLVGEGETVNGFVLSGQNLAPP